MFFLRLVVVTVTIGAILGSLHSSAAQDAKLLTPEPTAETLLSSQIVANSRVLTFHLPPSNRPREWVKDNGWKDYSPVDAVTYLVVVRIDDVLIDAVVAHWSHIHKAPKTLEEQAKLDLRRRFLRTDGISFLFMSSPPRDPRGKTYSAYSYEKIRSNIFLHTFSGEALPAKEVENCDAKNVRVTSVTPIFSCFFVLPSAIRPDHPTFRIEVAGIRAWIQHKENGEWISSQETHSAVFMFEPGAVNLIEIVMRKAPWPAVYDEVVTKRRLSVASMLGEGAATFLLNVASGFASGLLLKALR